MQSARFANEQQPVHAGHAQIRDEQVVVRQAQPIERGARVADGFDVVFRQRKRPREQFPNALLVVGDEHAMRRRARRALRDSRRQPDASPLRLEPRVEIALPEAPLPPDAHGRYLPRLDQPVDRPQVDLQVVDHFLGGEKRIVGHFAIGSVRTNRAPPSG